MPLTESQAKFLTKEVLGEKPAPLHCGIFKRTDAGSDMELIEVKYRDFTTPDDFFALRDALVKDMKWDRCMEFCIEEYKKIFCMDVAVFIEWLTSTDPDGVLRLVRLVLEWKGVE